jgi:hypothetical protein
MRYYHRFQNVFAIVLVLAVATVVVGDDDDGTFSGSATTPAPLLLVQGTFSHFHFISYTVVTRHVLSLAM